VTNEHTVEYQVDETMTPGEFKEFTKKLEQKGLSLTSEGGAPAPAPAAAAAPKEATKVEAAPAAAASKAA